MGERLGILAGAGRFPLYVAREAARGGREAVVAALVPDPDPGLKDLAVAFRRFDPREAARVLMFLKDSGVRDIVLAGKLDPRILLRPEMMDRLSRDLLSQVAERSPAAALKFLIGYLGHEGYRVLDPRPFLADCFTAPGRLTRAEPDPRVLREVEAARPKARLLADAEIGQTIVVKDGLVVAVEGLEGTDAAIARGGALAGPGTVAVKVARTGQDPRVDLPAVGLETVRALAAARAAALAFEAAAMPFFEREEAVAAADAAGVTILALGPAGAAAGRPS